MFSQNQIPASGLEPETSGLGNQRSIQLSYAGSCSTCYRGFRREPSEGAFPRVLGQKPSAAIHVNQLVNGRTNGYVDRMRRLPLMFLILLAGCTSQPAE